MENIQIPQYFLQNSWLAVLLLFWVIPWKAYALWKSARRNEKWWFLALLIINTAGILEILYIFIFGKDKNIKNSAVNCCRISQN